MAEILFFPSREVRTVTKGWRHPEDAGEHRPLSPEEMPDVTGLADHETEIAAYETGTRGTPISPNFPNTPQGRLQLVAHCAEHCTTWGYETAGAEAWAVILFGEGATVTVDGAVVAND
jgi:hypothetical protein